MHPSTRSISSTHGAEELDDQFEYIHETATEDSPTETRQENARNTNASSTTPAEHKVPHITPKIAPPKTIRRYSTTELPEVGAWVVLTVLDGKRRETLQGRVAHSDTKRIRLKQGAGWWVVPIGSIISISAGDDPAQRGS